MTPPSKPAPLFDWKGEASFDWKAPLPIVGPLPEFVLELTEPTPVE